MKILGIKFTHDAAVAVIEDDQLTWCCELEKRANAPRYTAMHEVTDLRDVMAEFGCDPASVHAVAVDGWKNGAVLTPSFMRVAPYHEFDAPFGALLTPEPVTPPPAGGAAGLGAHYWYSYRHVAGHVVGAYVTSPFTKQRTAVITWDGGQTPRLHFVDPTYPPQDSRSLQFVGELFSLYGTLYGIMGYYFGPYRNPAVAQDPRPLNAFGGRDVPGKLMSYVALGTPNAALLHVMARAYADIELDEGNLPIGERLSYRQTGWPEHRLMRAVARAAIELGVNDEDALATVHDFLETLLVKRACAAIPRGMPLCFSGGSALNIKWNTALRESGHFAGVWVPPFPNDSGSAIGAAACAWVMARGWGALKWSVFCGPRLRSCTLPSGWHGRLADVTRVAGLVALAPHEPGVVLHGAAEVGPRALGARSIVMSTERTDNKRVLNAAKRREAFRPVAPMCLEEDAPAIFYPGTPDPYMLFDHAVRHEWRERIPAVVHLDGTARLQTVNQHDNPVMYALITEVKRLTGIPVICNTSANLNGSGFFPDVGSACSWAEGAGVSWVWADGVLYTKDKS